MIEYDGSYVINYYFVLRIYNVTIFDGVFTVSKYLHSLDQMKELKRQLLDDAGYNQVKVEECAFETLVKLSKIYGDGRVE